MENPIASPQIKSYESFVHKIPKIAKEAPPISYEVEELSGAHSIRTRVEISFLDIYPEVEKVQFPPNYYRL